MQNRVVEIATDGVHLSSFRGFLKISKDGVELGRVALPDIGSVVVRGFGATLSLNLAARLASANIPVLCGANQTPCSIVWPVDGHHQQGNIFAAQADLTRPQKKRLWQSLIRAKIAAQANVLVASGESANDLLAMAARVKSGDPENLEAMAARKYWPRMMKPVHGTYKRNASENAVNAWLNYGYAVLRAGAARSILAAGLHPSLSIHHESRGEALRLASDIMEPFRPYVDLLVKRLALETLNDTMDLTPDRKAAIVRVLSLDLEGPFGASTVQTCLDRLCQSLAQICMGTRSGLELPSGLASIKESVEA